MKLILINGRPGLDTLEDYSERIERLVACAQGSGMQFVHVSANDSVRHQWTNEVVNLALLRVMHHSNTIHPGTGSVFHMKYDPKEMADFSFERVQRGEITFKEYLEARFHKPSSPRFERILGFVIYRWSPDFVRGILRKLKNKMLYMKQAKSKLIPPFIQDIPAILNWLFPPLITRFTAKLYQRLRAKIHSRSAVAKLIARDLPALINLDVDSKERIAHAVADWEKWLYLTRANRNDIVWIQDAHWREVFVVQSLRQRWPAAHLPNFVFHFSYRWLEQAASVYVLNPNNAVKEPYVYFDYIRNMDDECKKQFIFVVDSPDLLTAYRDLVDCKFTICSLLRKPEQVHDLLKVVASQDTH